MHKRVDPLYQRPATRKACDDLGPRVKALNSMNDLQRTDNTVPLERLNRRCRAAEFPFQTTAEITESDATLAQERALSALELGVRIGAAGHNIFLMGLPGSGRHAAVRRYLDSVAGTRPPPNDWCYLNRFEDPQRPKALRLRAGRGTQLKADMKELVRDLRAGPPEALESEAHHKRRAEVEREFDEVHRRSLEEVQKEAEKGELTLVQTPDGMAIVPVRKGEVLGREEFEALPEEERRHVREHMNVVGQMLRKHLEAAPRWQRDRHRRLRELDREATAAIVRVHIEELRAKYADNAEVLAHLTDVQTDLVENASSTLRGEQVSLVIPGLERLESHADLSRYDVNVLIDGRAVSGAPIVYEGNPTYQNLIGQIDTVAQLGMLKTDFTLVRAGALHRANGGFLILDAERLLTQPFAWEALKHALFDRCVRIESLGQRLSLISTLSLEPDRIPLAVRVVLIGTRHVYDLLCEYDHEFAELFKVAADFDDTIERTDENTQLYARVLAGSARREGLKPLEAAAVARLVEYGSRLAGDSRKLSTHLRSIEDALREADQFAAAAGVELVRASDVERALQEQQRRLARVHAEILDAIRSNSLLVETDGEAIGQVNGLSVTRAGTTLFGQPSRITATVRIGEGDVLDIEREVKLGGAIHSKGVLILSALIGARFGWKQPLSLHGSLVFEQSYGGVEGDSASLAEACALLSAIALVPLRQSLAVTGSINQRAVVQVIGGVNEKIEGFFEACRQRGLTGSQGVILPADNVPHLMLSDEVIASVERGSFHLYAVRTLDDALSLLTGLESGARDSSGAYPPGTFNSRVDERLRELAQHRQEFTREALLTPANATKQPDASS
jgi:predicted ATP-dependent protease